jgi:tellurite methyltransferase
MGADDRSRWNKEYYERVLRAYPPPDALLVAYAPIPDGPVPRRVALDLAAGQCQNAIWLAEQGYLVNAMDISHVALERGRAEMAMRNLRNVNFIQADLDSARMLENVYDLVCCFRFLDRKLFPMIKASVKPGGMVVYQTFNIRMQKRKPHASPEYLLNLRELPQHFAGWEIRHDEEVGDITRMVAVKPAAGGSDGA